MLCLAPIAKFPPKFKSVRMMYGENARKALVAGISTLAQVGQKTLGPGGRNIAIDYEAGEPKITKDGVTVLKSLHLGEREKEMGSKLLKRSTGSTNIFAGDGTTTSSILSREILMRGNNAIEYEGAHPVALKRGLDKSLQVVSAFLREISMPVTTEREVFNVCQVSSNYNEAIAQLVAKTLNTVGLDGVVNITESPTGFSRFAMVNGLVFERGYVSPLFLETMSQEGESGSPGEQTQQASQIVELEQPLILVIANQIQEVSQIAPILEKVKKTKRPLLLFSEDLQEEPMSTMIYNNQKDIVQCCAVNIPWTAGVEKENLKDIAVMTGATLIDEYVSLEDIELKHFGSAKIVQVDHSFTQIVGGGFSQEALDQRVIEIQATIDQEDSEHLKKVHRERLARMQHKIGEIQVGGGTDVERGEEYDLIIDALNSAKSSMKYGVLPGGGVALYQAAKVL